MAQLQFSVKNQFISRKDNFKPVAKSRNYLYAEFLFLTDEWQGTATAIFRNSDSAYEVILDATNTCLVPWEILDAEYGEFYVSVFCGDLVTANKARVRLYQSGYGDDLESSQDPTPSVYAQIIERMDGVEDIVIEKTALAEGYAEQAGESAASAAGSASTATQKAAEAARSAETASGAAGTAETAKSTAVEAAGASQTASQTAVNAAGSASASELSAAQSAQSASEDARTASNASQVASTKADEASQSASRAAASASEASTSATHAAGAATSASGYASDANASATAAAGSAQTASTKATQASASASSAEASANTASTANANAQAAKTAAETAQGAAEDAQEAAETARDAIQDSAAQIAQNTSDIDFLKEDLSDVNERLSDVRAGIFADVDQSKIAVSTGGRYINFSGVQGTADWSQLYQFDTEKGKDYYIYSYAPRVVPVLYFDGTAHPSSSQASDYRMGFIIRGNGQKAYINAAAVNKVVVEQPIISEGRYLPYTDSLASAELELADIKNDFSINSRNGYYITAQGVQGGLAGYNLKYFVGETGKVYFIKTQKRHAQSTIPLVYTNGTAYGVGEDIGILVFAGNNKTIYINTCEDFTYDIKEYMFTNYVNKPMFIDMFNDIVCCGDSLTYGLVYDTETSTRMATSPYPETLGKLTGCNITKLATSGFKASDWWNTYNQNITGSKKLYLIYLGTNGAITDTVDTDCVGDDYTQYAETETGYYGRIIQKIKDSGSSCIIVKVAKGTSAISNPSLIHMAERFNVPIVDNPATGDDSPLSNMYYHYGSATDYYNTVHMNDLGYAVFANMLLDNIKNLTIAEQYSIMPK